MKKAVEVSYPKRRHARDNTKITGVPEPARKTMYDVILENFKLAQRETFLHRIIYVGEHSFPKDNGSLLQMFLDSIQQVNDAYCIEPLTGFLLMYTRYFVHMVEGDEDSINKHLGNLLQNEAAVKNLGTMKLLVHVSHINQRFLKEWNYYYGTPSKLLGNIDLNSNLEETGRQIYSCIKKIYTLVSLFVDDFYCQGDQQKKSLIDLEEDDNFSFPSRIKSNMVQSTDFFSQVALRSSNTQLGKDPYRTTLPEYEVIDFILKTNFTHDIRKYYGVHGVCKQRDVYKDLIWPIPSDFIPYDVFSKPYDAIIELPKEKKTEKKASVAEEIVDKEEEIKEEGKDETTEQDVHKS